MATFIKRTLIHADVSSLYSWHASESAFEALIPPWESVKILQKAAGLVDNAEMVMAITPLPPFLAFLIPIQITWIARLQGCTPPHQFQDVQIKGPFAHWVHTHRFQAIEPSQTLYEDEVNYGLPFETILPPIVGLIDRWFVQPKLRRLFEFRHQVVLQAMAQSAASTT